MRRRKSVRVGREMRVLSAFGVHSNTCTHADATQRYTRSRVILNNQSLRSSDAGVDWIYSIYSHRWLH